MEGHSSVSVQWKRFNYRENGRIGWSWPTVMVILQYLEGTFLILYSGFLKCKAKTTILSKNWGNWSITSCRLLQNGQFSLFAVWETSLIKIQGSCSSIRRDPDLHFCLTSTHNAIREDKIKWKLLFKSHYVHCLTTVSGYLKSIRKYTAKQYKLVWNFWILSLCKLARCWKW